jgi:hypothetical protein
MVLKHLLNREVEFPMKSTLDKGDQDSNANLICAVDTMLPLQASLYFVFFPLAFLWYKPSNHRYIVLLKNATYFSSCSTEIIKITVSMCTRVVHIHKQNRSTSRISTLFRTSSESCCFPLECSPNTSGVALFIFFVGMD